MSSGPLVRAGSLKLGGLASISSSDLPRGSLLRPEVVQTVAGLTRPRGYACELQSYATGWISYPSAAGLVDNDSFRMPTGTGTWADFEFKITGGFVARPGYTTIDFSDAPALGVAIGRVIAAVLGATSLVLGATEPTGGIAFPVKQWFRWPTRGADANTYQITEDVAGAGFTCSGFAGGGVFESLHLNVDGGTSWVPLTQAEIDLYGATQCTATLSLPGPAELADGDYVSVPGCGLGGDPALPYSPRTRNFYFKRTAPYVVPSDGFEVNIVAAATIADVVAAFENARIGIDPARNCLAYVSQVAGADATTITYRYPIPGDWSGVAVFGVFGAAAPHLAATGFTVGVDDVVNLLLAQAPQVRELIHFLPSLRILAEDTETANLDSLEARTIALLALADKVSELLDLVDGVSTEEHYAAIGRALSGISRAAVMFADFEILSNVDGLPLLRRAASAGGNFTMSATEKSTLEVHSSATAGGSAFLDPTNDGVWLTGSPAAARWYYAARFAVMTAVDGSTIAALEIWDADGIGVVRFGVDGAVSTTHFVLSIEADASTLVTTVAIDAGIHLFELYRAAGAVFARIDGVDVGSLAAPVTWTGRSIPYPIYVQNGGVATDRAVALRWFLLLSEGD